MTMHAITAAQTSTISTGLIPRASCSAGAGVAEGAAEAVGSGEFAGAEAGAAGAEAGAAEAEAGATEAEAGAAEAEAGAAEGEAGAAEAEAAAVDSGALAGAEVCASVFAAVSAGFSLAAGAAVGFTEEVGGVSSKSTNKLVSAPPDWAAPPFCVWAGVAAAGVGAGVVLGAGDGEPTTMAVFSEVKATKGISFSEAKALPHMTKNSMHRIKRDIDIFMLRMFVPPECRRRQTPKRLPPLGLMLWDQIRILRSRCRWGSRSCYRRSSRNRCHWGSSQ